MSKNCNTCRWSCHVNNKEFDCFNIVGKCSLYDKWEPRACGFCKHLDFSKLDKTLSEHEGRGDFYYCEPVNSMRLKDTVLECEHFQNCPEPIEPKQREKFITGYKAKEGLGASADCIYYNTGKCWKFNCKENSAFIARECTNCNHELVSKEAKPCSKCNKDNDEWEAKEELEDFEYLNINGIEYINKFEERDKKQKEVSKMEDVSKEISKINKKIKEVKEKRSKYLEDNYKIIIELFEKRHSRSNGSYNHTHWYGISNTFQTLMKETLSKKQFKQLKKLRSYEKYFYYKNNRYDKLDEDINKKKWDLLVILIEECKRFKEKYLLTKAKRELCRRTDCYKELSDTKGQCIKCGKDIPKEKDIKFCYYCGELIKC